MKLSAVTYKEIQQDLQYNHYILNRVICLSSRMFHGSPLVLAFAFMFISMFIFVLTKFVDLHDSACLHQVCWFSIKSKLEMIRPKAQTKKWKYIQPYNPGFASRHHVCPSKNCIYAARKMTANHVCLFLFSTSVAWIKYAYLKPNSSLEWLL